MATLKELKTRISSVKSTQKITSAMKMVAASRLKRAQEAAEAARPYVERMERMMASILDNPGALEGAGALLGGTGSDDTHLIVVVTSDRGLCGGFNSSISREARKQIRALKADSKNVKILCVGRKGRDQLKTEFGNTIVETYEGIGKAGVPAIGPDRRRFQQRDKRDFQSICDGGDCFERRVSLTGCNVRYEGHRQPRVLREVFFLEPS